MRDKPSCGLLPVGQSETHDGGFTWANTFTYNYEQIALWQKSRSQQQNAEQSRYSLIYFLLVNDLLLPQIVVLVNLFICKFIYFLTTFICDYLT